MRKNADRKDDRGCYRKVTIKKAARRDGRAPGRDRERVLANEKQEPSLQKTLKWSSEEGRRADALALGADEGRDKLR